MRAHTPLRLNVAEVTSPCERGVVEGGSENDGTKTLFVGSLFVYFASFRVAHYFTLFSFVMPQVVEKLLRAGSESFDEMANAFELLNTVSEALFKAQSVAVRDYPEHLHIRPRVRDPTDVTVRRCCVQCVMCNAFQNGLTFFVGEGLVVLVCYRLIEIWGSTGGKDYTAARWLGYSKWFTTRDSSSAGEVTVALGKCYSTKDVKCSFLANEARN